MVFGARVAVPLSDSHAPGMGVLTRQAAARVSLRGTAWVTVDLSRSLTG